MGGDQPTEVDCVLFGFLSVILYACSEDSVLRIVLEKRLGNLLQFTKRMKANYYPDWDDLVGRQSLTELKKNEGETTENKKVVQQNTVSHFESKRGKKILAIFQDLCI